MRLHTSLSYANIAQALQTAQDKGLVSRDVVFAEFAGPHKSNSHPNGYRIQLGATSHHLPEGTVNQYGKRQKTRRVRNSGVLGASGECDKWSATYDEWGWFMAEIFRRDTQAVFGNVGGSPKTSWGYRGAEDFHRQTGNKFTQTARERVRA
jgi:hypothetical protein